MWTIHNACNLGMRINQTKSSYKIPTLVKCNYRQTSTCHQLLTYKRIPQLHSHEGKTVRKRLGWSPTTSDITLQKTILEWSFSDNEVQMLCKITLIIIQIQVTQLWKSTRSTSERITEFMMKKINFAIVWKWNGMKEKNSAALPEPWWSKY